MSKEERLLGRTALCSYLGLSENTAVEFAKQAGAEIRYGRRVLYDKEKINDAIDELLKGYDAFKGKEKKFKNGSMILDISQIDNGCVKIPNHVIDELVKINLSGADWKVILCILRYTYGISQKSHRLSSSFIAKHTNINFRTVKKSVLDLRKANIIICLNPDERGVCNELMLNENTDEWRTSQEQECVKMEDLIKEFSVVFDVLVP